MKTIRNDRPRLYRLGVMASVVAALVLIASSIVSFIAVQHATTRQQVANEARERAQHTMSYVLDQTHPHLRSLGGNAPLINAARAAVRHFEQLPPELLDHPTRKSHARALYRLIRYFGFPGRSQSTHWPELDKALQKALPLWQEVALHEPSDGEAAARAHHLAWFAGEFSFAEDHQSLRDLDRRYPENREVQLYLGQRAADMGYHGADHGREREGLEITIWRLQSIDDLLASYPHDSEIRILKAKLLGGLAVAYESTGQSALSSRSIQQATKEIESVLAGNPANVEALTRAVGLAIIDLNATIGDHIRFGSILNRTQNRLQGLRSLNPNNQVWLAWEAQLAHLESIDSFRIGDLDGARLHEERTLDLAGSMQATGGDRCQVVGSAFLSLGTIEYLAGNRDVARTYVIHLQEVIRKLRANPGLGEPLQEWEAMLSLAILHTRMRNCAELEKVSREMLARESKFAELTLYDREGHTYQRELRTAIASGLHGQALFELGHSQDAIAPLEIAVTRFRNRPSTAPHRICSKQLILENAVSLGRAQHICGNTTRALQVLEWAYEGYRDFLPERGDWYDLLGAAKSAWHLADVLDREPIDRSVRIYEVLTQAAHWLDLSAAVRPLDQINRDLCLRIDTRRQSMNRFSRTYLTGPQLASFGCR